MSRHTDQTQTRQTQSALDELVDASQRLGRDPNMVLHGGGNTSIKADWVDITGDVIDAIFVKGSGWDLATIERAGFTPMPLARLRAILALDELSDPDMVRELAAAKLDPSFPQPSVEALLHAFLPHRAVLHSHADLILTLTNIDQGEAVVRQVFGNKVVVVPYVMPGFDLARAVRAQWEQDAGEDTIGMVLMNHGLFAFGDSCNQAYERHMDLIALAEAYVSSLPAAEVAAAQGVPPVCALELAKLRQHASELARKPLVMTRHANNATLTFAARDDVAAVATRGPLTPDHVLFTKPAPLVGRDVDAYAQWYESYFERYKDRASIEPTMLDPTPRVVLDPEYGMLTLGVNAKSSQIVADIYHHTIEVITTCEDRQGGWIPLERHHQFDVEYWDLEQAKLRRSGHPPALEGQIALVTGAASGIGRACAARLLGEGAAVIGLDISHEIASSFEGSAWQGIQVDVTNESAHAEAIARAAECFGGIDIAVLSAGIFGSTASIADTTLDNWRQVMTVNVDAAVHAMSQIHPFLAVSPANPSLVLIGSKNVHAPGAGAAAYSASKAALTQIGKIAALEWASDGIRVNMIHPDAVFDTGLWDAELLTQRADHYDMTVDEYKTRNLLSTEVTSDRVAEMAIAMIGLAFGATTGAQVHVDGGSDRTL